MRQRVSAPPIIWPLFAALTVAGCLPGAGYEIADAVRDVDSPLVEEVTVSGWNPAGHDYEDVKIYLFANATDDDVKALWCDVIVPVGPERLGRGSVWFEIGREDHGGFTTGGRLIPEENLPPCS